MKRTLTFSLLALSLLTLSFVSPSLAQVTAAPSLMNFQGRLTKPDSTPVTDGTYSVRFSLWDAITAGTETWNQTIGSVAVKNGTFAVQLSGFPTNTFNSDQWLEIKIGTDAPLTPRQPLVSVPYALKANTVPDGSITGASIANGAITSDKLASDTFNNLAWLLGGNSGTNPASQFLGTSDNQSLVFRTNNLERMRLLADGNLGIGILTPVARVDIRGGESPVGAPAFIVGGLNGAQGQRAIAGMYSTFMNVPADTNARRTADIVAGFGGGAWGTEYLALHVGNNGAANDASALTSEKLRILSNGKLGLGTNTPGYKLDVAGTETFGLRYLRTDARDARISVGDNTKTWSLATGWAVAGDLSIIEEGAAGDRFYIQKTTGNVGIGTATPGAKLDVNGGIKVNGANVLELGAGVAGKEVNAGKIGYRAFSPDALDIVGAGTSGTNRKIKFWAEGGATFGPVIATEFRLTTGAGANKVLTSDASGNATWQTASGGGTAGGDLTGTYPNPTLATLASSLAKVSGNVMSSDGNKVGINGNRVLELGLGVAGKEGSAGKIGYQTFSDALDIVGAGTSGANRKIKFWNEGGAAFAGGMTVAGEITANVVTVLGGSDVAEPYYVAPAGAVKAIPGMVVAIDPDKVGQMRVVSKAYDKTVAGIVSGANGINPGITLRQKGTIADGELPVASIGRVWCWCNADANGAIEAGDMLTTSDTPGHAMKVSDHNRANGSVIGKAMSSLKSGKGLVLVLVSLK